MPRYVFFDNALVVNGVNKGVRRALSKFGAYVRRTARQSLRPATKRTPVSKPGDPPRMHVGTPKTRLFFAYDSHTKSVVVGSEKTKVGRVLKVLEYGGRTTIHVKPRKTKYVHFKVGDYGCIRVRNPNATTNHDRFYWTLLKTQAMANRANRLYMAYNPNNGQTIPGYTYTKKQAKRPYMRPAFKKNCTHARLAACFARCVKP